MATVLPTDTIEYVREVLDDIDGELATLGDRCNRQIHNAARSLSGNAPALWQDAAHTTSQIGELAKRRSEVLTWISFPTF